MKRQHPPLVALWLILATVFLHALLPVGSPMSRTVGSAFSATTVDVSLAPNRNGASTLIAQQEAISNVGLGGPDPVRLPAALLPLRISAPAFTPESTPARPSEPELASQPTRSRPYIPRAPPLS